jgi:transcriptional regulator with XRE-family HTH domain
LPAGRSVTYPRVVELLSKRVSEIGQRAVARESGITLKAVQRYIGGESEPTLASLEKLSKYFNVLIPWLRGEGPNLTYEDAKKQYITSALNNCSWLKDKLQEIEMKELLFRSAALAVYENSSESDIAYTINEIQRTMQEIPDGWKRIFQERLIDLNNILIQKFGHSLLPPHP